ncbi:MAG: hypothetical protein ACNFW9_06090 [Candidatus Kerfeldbacteria bacterium]
MTEKGNNLTIKDIKPLLLDKSVRDALIFAAESKNAKLYSEVTCSAIGQKHPVLRPSGGDNNTYEFRGMTLQICECTTCGCSLSVPIEPHKFEQLI